MYINKKVWNLFAGIYEKVRLTGKKNKEFYNRLSKEIEKQLRPNMKVLELAMGPAMLTEEIAQNCRQLYATDYSEKMIAQAKKKKLPDNVIIKQADATDLHYKDESFDAIIIANALHSMPNPEQAIKEMKRVLKKTGIIIAPTMTRIKSKDSLRVKLMNAVGFYAFFHWDDKEYRKYLSEHGLAIIYHARFYNFGLMESFVVCKK